MKIEHLCKHLLIGALLAVPASVLAQDWENPGVFGINKLPYNATLNLPSVHSDEDTSLGGLWSFHWSRCPEERPAQFYEPGYDVSAWDKIKVPGNWQTQGYGKPLDAYKIDSHVPRSMTVTITKLNK